jgi:hypothetical protein
LNVVENVKEGQIILKNERKQNKTMEMYIVRSISLVNYLCQRGFRLLKAEDSNGDAKYKVFMFEDCPEIRDTVAAYLSIRKRV